MKLFLLVLLPLFAQSYDPECLDDNGKPLSSKPFAIENNCDAFYQCSGGHLSSQNCAKGTVFNPQLSVCDFPYNVEGCDQQTIIACENKPAVATCPTDHVIVVKDGFYGRDDGETCPHKAIKTTNCSAEGSEDKLVEACDQANSCQIQPNNRVFGDPCRGTYKYVKMNFYCRKQTKTYKKVICEYRSKTISCADDQVIYVKTAFYGRDDRKTCLSFLMKDTSCSADGALEKIRDSCNDKSSCTIKAHNSVFGDPCFGTKKYVEMVYECREKQEEADPCVDSNGRPISGAPFEKPGDCSHFYQCANGVRVTLPCAPGTAFNPSIGVCDWPSNVPGCN